MTLPMVPPPSGVTTTDPAGNPDSSLRRRRRRNHVPNVLTGATLGGRSARSHPPHSRKRRFSGKILAVDDITLSVPPYDPAIGVVSPTEGGCVTVEIVNGSVEIFGDPAGLRDLARLCMALSDPRTPRGAHIHLDPGINPLDLGSVSLMLARDPRSSDT